MIKCATSLWSADLANLASDIRWVEPYSDRFHIDVIDGHYFPQLLFFPDLVKAARKHTKLPFEVHFMVTEPQKWVGPFIDAGADGFLINYGDVSDLGAWIADLRKRDKYVGVSLSIEKSVELIEPYLDTIDFVTIFGTIIGIKGADMHPTTPDRIRQLRKLIDSKPGRKVEIQIDGGIRRHTVPLMRAAGADCIVPGSLMFGEDPIEMRKWLASLDAPN